MEDIIITDFAALEQALAKIDKTAVAYWVGVNGEYEAAVAAMPEGKSLSVRAWALAWQGAVKTRSAQAVQQTLSTVRGVIDKGYDAESFDSIAHMQEVLRGKKPAAAPAKKSAKARRLALINTAAFRALPQADQDAIKATLGL